MIRHEDEPRLSGVDVLALLRMEDEKLLRVLDGLTAEQWAAETNCPGWSVHHMVAHLVRGVESYVAAIENGRHGDFTRLTADQRRVRMEFFAGHTDERLLDLLAEYMQRFQDVFGGFDEEQLQSVRGAHVYGQMRGAWFINQRLAEVAFHSWDIRSSLGLDTTFDAGVANVLLPVIIRDNLRFALRTTEPLVLSVGRWTVSLPDGAETDQPPEVVIQGSAAKVCLLLYGRDRSLDGLQVQGHRRLLAALAGP